MKLIVIDVQKGITDERLYDFDGFIRNVTSIVEAARKRDLKLLKKQLVSKQGCWQMLLT